MHSFFNCSGIVSHIRTHSLPFSNVHSEQKKKKKSTIHQTRT
jgi:hypothetical protein